MSLLFTVSYKNLNGDHNYLTFTSNYLVHQNQQPNPKLQIRFFILRPVGTTSLVSYFYYLIINKKQTRLVKKFRKMCKSQLSELDPDLNILLSLFDPEIRLKISVILAKLEINFLFEIEIHFVSLFSGLLLVFYPIIPSLSLIALLWVRPRDDPQDGSQSTRLNRISKAIRDHS